MQTELLEYPAGAVALAFAVAAVGVAIAGVVLQNEALRVAELGEVPDYGGAGFLAGSPGGSYETGNAFYIDLRAHYRRSASALSMQANLILLVSVVAGVLSGEASNVWVGLSLAVLWIVAAALSLCYAMKRRGNLRTREAALESRRAEYNAKFIDNAAAQVGEESQVKPKAIAPFERVRW